MKSPFPGMDPYLERHWLDVHTSLVADARAALNERLPDDLAASAEERVAVESEAGRDAVVGPDVRITTLAFEPTLDPAGATALAPLRLVAHVDPVPERFIRVIEFPSGRLVTVIEFVSPTNKRGKGLRAFRRNRRQLLASGVNVVEVDLVRTGNWAALLAPHRCPDESVTPYRVTLRVPGDPDSVFLHPAPLRQPLPTIVVPLRAEDPQVRLDLQALIERAYVTGRYGRKIDYHTDPKPPLGEPDAAWANEMLRAAGRR